MSTGKGGNGQGNWRQIGDLSAIGLFMVIATVLGVGLGIFLGNITGYKTLFLILGIFWGVAAGFLNLYRKVKKLSAKDAGEDGPKRGS